MSTTAGKDRGTAATVSRGIGTAMLALLRKSWFVIALLLLWWERLHSVQV